MKLSCDNCNSDYKYNDKYDAFYCEKCNQWAEKKCRDVNCIFCPDRPEKPVRVKNQDGKDLGSDK